MLVKVSALVAFANTLINVVLSSPVFETNAERMARGLAPNPPVQFVRRATAVGGGRLSQ